MPTQDEIVEELKNGNRHPVNDADTSVTSGLDWVEFYHEASDGESVKVSYNLAEIESFDGDGNPVTVYPDE